MKRREHLFFRIRKSDFLTKSNINSVSNSLIHPKNKFPQDFSYREDELFIAGYFVSYNRRIATSQLVQLCKIGKWKEISSLIGDYIILYCDLASKKILVLTDQTGKFPCYFSLTKDEFVVSTSFNKVISSIACPTLDISEALDYIHRNMGVKDTTSIQEIKQIPPATLFLLDKNWSYTLSSLINPDEILAQPFIRYKTIDEFTQVFISATEKILTERLEAVKNFQICAELSSGFDSTLIAYLLKNNLQKSFACYTHLFIRDPGYTNPKAVEEFAEKHKLEVRLISHDHLFPFSTKEDLEWVKREPVGQTGMADAYYDLLIKMRERDEVCFEGHGGDEIYRTDATTLELNLRFPLQVEYFERLQLANFGIDKVITQKGLGVLFNRKRFQEKNPYFLTISNSAATTFFNNFFPLFWETNIWFITPFIDPRLVQVTRGIPKPHGQHLTKQEIWGSRQDIFVPSQFIRKRGPDEQFKRYLTEKAELLVSILENSVLGPKGWVKSSEIIKDLKEKNIEKYTTDDAMSYLVNLVGLEYFIQQNKVKVP